MTIILKKPYTQQQKFKFIVEYNLKKSYNIEETEDGLVGTPPPERDLEQEDKENIAKLHVTRLDFINILESLGISWINVKAFMANYPEVEKELMMCSNVYRGNELINNMIPVINKAFGLTITESDLDEAFIQVCGYKRIYQGGEE